MMLKQTAAQTLLMVDPLFFQRRADEVREAVVTRGELLRLRVPRGHLDHYIDLIKK
jgi:hypothetical protein